MPDPYPFKGVRRWAVLPALLLNVGVVRVIAARLAARKLEAA